MSDQTQSSGTASQGNQSPIVVNVSVARPTPQFAPPTVRSGSEMMTQVGSCGCGCGASNGGGSGV